MKAHIGHGGTTALILNISFTRWLLTSQGSAPVL